MWWVVHNIICSPFLVDLFETLDDFNCLSDWSHLICTDVYDHREVKSMSSFLLSSSI